MTGSRRHNSPVESPPSDTDSGTIISNVSNSSSKEQDRFLPIANVSRIMKKSLPANAKISKEAKETVQECVSEFISFITGEASDKCSKEKRKTINGDDLLWAMTALGFENYVGSLKIYLNKYRETEGEKNSMARQGDQSPTEDTTITNGVNEIINLSSTKANISGFNRGFNLHESPVIPQRFGDGGRVFGYGDNSNMGALQMGRIYENGDGNGSRVRVNHDYGVEW